MLRTRLKTSFHKASALSGLARNLFLANPKNRKLELVDIAHPEVLGFLKQLHLNKVRYLLVGGMATTFHGYVRTTQDLDLWVDNSPENKERLIQSLKNVAVVGAEHLRNIPLIAGWSTVTIGNEGFVADFMTDLKSFAATDFDTCYKKAATGVFEGIPIKVIHKNDLIREKKANSRPKDLDDVEQLERIARSYNKNCKS